MGFRSLSNQLPVIFLDGPLSENVQWNGAVSKGWTGIQEILISFGIGSLNPIHLGCMSNPFYLVGLDSSTSKFKICNSKE